MIRHIKTIALVTIASITLSVVASCDIWVDCLSNLSPMSTIGYNETYTVTTSAGGEQYPLGIKYGEVRLYSNTMPSGGSYRGWTFKDSTGTASHQWSVVNQEHDVYVNWKAQVTIYNYSNGTSSYLDSDTPGPFYTP